MAWGRDGTVVVPNGNLKIGTAGKGIDFSAQTATATGTTTSEILDSYEEGTFSPKLTFETPGTASFTETVGHYRKIGSFVYFSVLVTTTVGNASGYAKITDLPFNCNSESNTRIYADIYYHAGWDTVHGRPWGYQGTANNNYVFLYHPDESGDWGGNHLNVLASDCESSVTLRLGGWYEA